jgi:hypothetical protein
VRSYRGSCLFLRRGLKTLPLGEFYHFLDWELKKIVATNYFFLPPNIETMDLVFFPTTPPTSAVM